MNDKITFQELTALLSLGSGLKKETCELFLRKFIAVVSESLEQGESVKLKGFGTFKVATVEARKSVDVVSGKDILIPAHKKITFMPAKELAEEVNAPFEAFEAVELSDDEDFPESAAEEISSADEYPEGSVEVEPAEDIAEEDAEESPISFSAAGLREIEESTEIFAVDEDEESQEEEVSDSNSLAESSEGRKEEAKDKEDKEDKKVEDKEESTDLSPENEPAENNIPVSEPSCSNQEKPREKKHRFLKGFLWGVGCGIAVCVIALLAVYAVVSYNLTRINEYDKEPKIVKTEKAPVPTVSAEADSTAKKVKVDSTKIEADAKKTAEAVATAPSSEIAETTDVISRTRYLTTMAKDHYGNYHLWPYIYEENKSILGHPDRIKPGTRVRIPDLRKYGVDPKNPADIKRAKAKGVEIYSRYK